MAIVPVGENLWDRGTDGMKEWIAVLRAADMAAQWHVHQRSYTASGRGLRRRPKALPLGAAQLVDVHV